MTLAGRAVAALVLLTVPAVVLAQTAGTTVVSWYADDSARVADLTARGRPYVRPSIIVWASPDSLDPARFTPFVDSLAAAVAHLRQLIGAPLPWQRLGSRPIHFYLSPGRFVSHADGRGGVFVSLARARDRHAPFLHEAAHELLEPPPPFVPFDYPDSAARARAAAAFPFWLSEGLPDYLAQTVAAETGFAEGDVFAIGGLAKADSVCAARIRDSPRGAEVQERVGRTGRLAALLTDERPQVAPIYYACSQSFTRHLVERVGLPVVVALFPRIPSGTWRAAVDSAAGTSLEALRREWTVKLGLPQGSR